MNSLKKYKNKFFSLLESEVGNVKPLISEESSFESANILELSKEMANQQGIGEDISEYVDTDNPTCVPSTGDQENDGIISKIWDWANNPANRSSLKTTLESLKNAIIKSKEEKKEVNEQTGVGIITIAGIVLTPSILIAIGAILVLIIIIAIVSKSGKKRSSCKRRSKLFKKHGIDGMFM